MLKKILICGFSGSGKTTLLNELQKTYLKRKNDTPVINKMKGWIFQDLDELIVKSVSLTSVEDFIKCHSWEKFRQKEREYLTLFLEQESSGVLSLGGGALSLEILEELEKKYPEVAICYIRSSFENCYRRLLNDLNVEPRPLLNKGKDEMERIYEMRSLVFDQISRKKIFSWVLDNDEDTPISHLEILFWENVERA